MRARTLAPLLGLLLGLAGASLTLQQTSSADEALTIESLTPATVAAGDRVTIVGDFASIDGARPRVFAMRDGVRRKLRLRVVEHDASSIVAVVRKVPNPARSPSDGANWTLHVAAPGRRHHVAGSASTPLVTSAPVIEDVRPDAIHAGWDLLLLARCPGARRPRVLFGDDAIPSRSVRVVRDETADDGLCQVWARVPHRVGNGVHQVALKARLGKVSAAKRPKVAGCDEPPPPPPKLNDTVEMNATVTGLGFEKELKKGFVFAEFVFGNTIVIQGCFNEGANETCAQFVNLTIGYQEDSRDVGPALAARMAYTDSTDFGNGSGTGVNDLFWEAVSGLRVEIVESSSTRIKGTFTGTVLADREDVEPQRLDVDGTFVIKR